MGKLSHIDKHSPVVQTDQPNPEQPKPTLDPPQKPQWKKEVDKELEEQKGEQKKTGTR
jgi:hypothetical protein